MGYAGGVFRGGAERRAEALVLVVVDYGEQFRSGGVVRHSLTVPETWKAFPRARG